MIHTPDCRCEVCCGVWVHQKFQVIHHHGDIRIQNDETLAPREVATLRVLLDQAERAAKFWRYAQLNSSSREQTPVTQRSNETQ